MIICDGAAGMSARDAAERSVAVGAMPSAVLCA